MIPRVEVIDGDDTLTGENANRYWSSVMPAAWSYCGNQLGSYGVRLAVAHMTRCLNISPSSVPSRGTRC